MFFRADKGCARADRGYVADELADGAVALGSLTVASGQLLVGEGTAGAPAIAFAADPDTGIARVGNVFQFVDEGSAIAEVVAAALRAATGKELQSADGDKLASIERVAFGTLVAATGFSPIPGTADIVIVDFTCGAVTITATPSIAAGHHNGQILIFRKDSVAGNVVFQDEAVLANSNLENDGAANKTVTADDQIAYQWDGTDWNQLTTVMNL